MKRQGVRDEQNLRASQHIQRALVHGRRLRAGEGSCGLALCDRWINIHHAWRTPEPR